HVGDQMQLELGATGSITDIKKKAAAAQRQEQAARERLLQAERERAFWDSLAIHVAAENAAQVLLLLRQGEGYLRHLKTSGDAISEVLEGIRLSAEGRARDAAAALGRDFPAAVRAAGVEIDSTSRHPQYTFKGGFLRVDLNERDLTATVAARDGDQTLMGMDVAP